MIIHEKPLKVTDRIKVELEVECGCRGRPVPHEAPTLLTTLPGGDREMGSFA